ncbi:MAG TPA: hypothetical protein VKT77_06065, partial [Chthonomonadaceae bacterium]|nr:hypothetical protein [Chthonomonadaceae bacterium]
ITARVGVPTQLAASLRIKPGSRVFSADAPNGRKVEKDGTVKSGPKRPPTDHGADRSAATPGAPAITKPSPQSDTAVSANAKPGRPAGKGKGDPSTTTLSGGPATPGGQAAQRGKPVFTDAAEPVRGAATAPSVAPPPTVPKTDYEAQAARFRQTGDMSGAVVALRKAVNDKPRDIGVRRELIQVYQALQMPEAAHAEALRALRLDANNAALYRLYGEVLAAEGDTTGAMNAFQDGIKIDPSDIGCQIALGDALLAQNHFLQAVDSYTAASKIDPKSPLPHRRMARAFAARAGTDPDQYQASLAEVRSALDLSVPGDTTLYAEDYVAILRIVDGRIRDMLEEIQNAYEARVQLKKSPAELMREIADINQRSDAIATYLAKLAPATGYDVTQAHYVQSNALFSQAVGFFKDLVQTGEERYASSMKSGQVQAQRELAVAGQRLTGTRSNEKTRKP